MNRLRKLNTATHILEEPPLRRSAPSRHERHGKVRSPGFEILINRPQGTLVLSDLQKRHAFVSDSEQLASRTNLSFSQRTALAILSGIALGLGATLLSFSFPSERSAVVESAVTTASLAGESSQAISSVGINESAALVETAKSAVDFAQGKSVSLHEPRFLNILESSSTYGPDLIAPSAEINFSDVASSKYIPDLMVKGQTARYAAGEDSLEWQGFKLSDQPSSNIELGRAYHQYLSRGMSTSDLGGKITSTQRHRTTISGGLSR